MPPPLLPSPRLPLSLSSPLRRSTCCSPAPLAAAILRISPHLSLPSHSLCRSSQSFSLSPRTTGTGGREASRAMRRTRRPRSLEAFTAGCLVWAKRVADWSDGRCGSNLHIIDPMPQVYSSTQSKVPRVILDLVPGNKKSVLQLERLPDNKFCTRKRLYFLYKGESLFIQAILKKEASY